MPRLLTRGDDPSPISTTGWPASSRNGGRHQIGTLAGFASEWVAGFRRNPHHGRHRRVEEPNQPARKAVVSLRTRGHTVEPRTGSLPYWLFDGQILKDDDLLALAVRVGLMDWTSTKLQ